MGTFTVALVVDTLGNAGNGTSNSAMQFARELEKEGIGVRLVGMGAPDERYRAREQYIPVVTEFARPHQMAFAHADDEFFARAFHDVDIVHIYMPFPFGRAAVRYCKKHGVPVTAGFHVQPENIVSNAPFLGLIPHIVPIIYRWMWNGLYRFIDHVHVPTQMEKRQLVEHGYTQKLHVFSNGYDDQLFTARYSGGSNDSHDREHTPRRFTIVASGRLSAEKDQETLIRAVALSKYVSDINLTIAGAGPLENKLRHIAEQTLPRGQWSIEFITHMSMPEFLAQADLFVHTSRADIEGISVLEALAVGVVPVIASAPLSAAGDFALCDESLFAVGDAHELARRIDWWIEHPSEREKWGREYAQHTHNYYSLSASVHQFIEMEREALDGR